MGIRCLVVSLVLMMVAGVVVGGPIGVSPGAADEAVQIESSCPTFSWALATSAKGYELVVVDLEEGAEGSADPSGQTPVLHIKLPAGTGSWTPQGFRCLEPGKSYAWFVRAEGDEGGKWSSGLAFEVASRWAEPEVDEIIDRVVARLLERGVTAPALSSGESGTWVFPRSLAPADGSTATARPTEIAAQFNGTPAIKGDGGGQGEVYGVLGVHNSTENDSAGVAGESLLTSGRTVGVKGMVVSNQGDAIRGENRSTIASGDGEEWASGVLGESANPKGLGVIGIASSSTGLNVGVAGSTESADGFGGFFLNEASGSLIGATSTPDDLVNLMFEVEADGTTRIAGPLVFKPVAALGLACNTAHKGWLYYDSSVEELCFCDASTWKQVDGGGGC